MKKTYKTFINEEIMHGDPMAIESMLKCELANQLLKMGANDYENVCNNMRIFADVFEILEEHINDDFILLKYNPMGSWYNETNELEIDYYKNEDIPF